ncbi:hemolysin family protein [candidate division KSB1 bacterium]|nr:hemolysin family protein [candidate division KSB1 bacterium]
MFAIVVITAVSLVGSFICSLMEAALYSIPRSRIETLQRAGHRGAARLAKLRARIDEPIAAILTLNTAANTLGAAWAGALVGKYYGNELLGIFSGTFTAAVLFFSEIIPKSLGVTYANTLAPRLAGSLQILIWLLWPFVKISVVLTRLWGKQSRLTYPTEEDIISLAQLSQSGGAIMPHEARWVANALRLNDMRVRAIMTPNSVVYRLPDVMPLSMTKIDADHWRFSRVPVCTDNDPNNIVGVVQRREVFAALLRDEEDKTIRNLMRVPDFVPEDMPAHELLSRFIASRRHLFCVKSANGEFAGVVTLEDVLEALIGDEIVGEFDLHEDMQAWARKKQARNSKSEKTTDKIIK